MLLEMLVFQAMVLTPDIAAIILYFLLLVYMLQLLEALQVINFAALKLFDFMFESVFIYRFLFKSRNFSELI